MENKDNQHRLPAAAKSGGRRKASFNYKIDEDMKLATAYVHVTTTSANAGRTLFWDKVRDHFIQSGGSTSRTVTSLQNRFQKVLHTEISHYIGYLQSALRDHHRGWSRHDYSTQAKSMFLSKHGKQFPHDIVYDILRSLPLYKIDMSTIDSRVCRESFSNHRNDKGKSAAPDRYASVGRNLSIGVGEEVDVYGIPLVRPVGIKKAKRLAMMAKAANNEKKRKAEEHAAQRQLTTDTLKRLADAAEASVVMMKERLKFQVFSANPESDASRAYFNRMRVGHVIHDVDADEE